MDLHPQSEDFSFFRIPRQLVKGRAYHPLSPAAKLLFGLLLDRVSLSIKNGWRDAEGRTYVYYTIAEICEDFDCSRVTANGIVHPKRRRSGKYGIC